MSIPANVNPLLLAADAAAAGGLQVSRSLRFNSADSAYLSRTPASAGNRKTWTWSAWIKRSALGAFQPLFVAGVTAGQQVGTLGFSSAGGVYDKIDLNFGVQGVSTEFWLNTIQLFRDPSAWQHIVCAVDTTQATASNRVRLYVNGVEITALSSFGGYSQYPSLNYDTSVNNTVEHLIGRDVVNVASGYFSGYLANIHFIDGQALTPASFAETDATTGQWIPKAFSGGSYGTNGFYLQFADNSSNTASTLGKDTSPNGNNWTPNNFSVIQGGSYNYSSTFVSSPSGFDPGAPASNAFDGILTTYANNNSGGDTLTWTTSSYGLSGTIRIYGWGSAGTPTVNVNGSSTGITLPSSSAWTTIGTYGTINSIAIVTTGANGAYIGAFEINGILINNNSVGTGNDSLVDSPTNYGTDTYVGGEVRGNYATLNPLDNGGQTLANGNLDITGIASNWRGTRGTIGMSSGKWYWEVTISFTNSGSNQSLLGIATNAASISGNYASAGAYGWEYYSNNGNKFNNGSNPSYGAAYTSGDVIGIAFDADSGSLTFYKNGSSQGTAYTGLTSGPYFPSFSLYGTSLVSFNGGQRAFAYTAPSGFKALCTQNLSAPLVTKSNTVMDVVLYTGTGASRSITGLNFNPDFVWIKSRSIAEQHELYDAVRGTGKTLYTDYTDAEGTFANGLTSFNSDGFSLGDRIYDNGSGKSYVAWAWDAGTSTVTNNSGSISSQVRANATAGFSVVTWTSDGASSVQTMGHGLGTTPGLIIAKNRSISGNWWVWHSTFSNQVRDYLLLQTTDAKVTAGVDVWSTSSTTFGIRQATIANSTNLCVAYCFAPVAGNSSFGSYTGNGSSDGPFVFTGMRPRWIMVKQSSTTSNWVINDTARDTYNVCTKSLFANLSSAEDTTYGFFDILSNGFKVRTSALNDNGATMIYAAFAEAPFNYSRAR